MNIGYFFLAFVIGMFISITGGVSVGEAVIHNEQAHAFDKACAMDKGTVQDQYICVVNGKAVLFN
jgi:hypothetical protein